MYYLVVYVLFIYIQKVLYLVFITKIDTWEVNIPQMIERYEDHSFWLPGSSSVNGAYFPNIIVYIVKLGIIIEIF